MSVVHDNVTNVGNLLAKAAQEFHDAAENLGQAKNRFTPAKEALTEANGNMENYVTEIETEGCDFAQEARI